MIAKVLTAAICAMDIICGPLKVKYGELNLEVPRDRNGAFNTQTISSYQRQTDGLEATVVQLYEKGITTNEIADLIEKMYGAHYTPQTVPNLTKVVDQQVNNMAFSKLIRSDIRRRNLSTFAPRSSG